MTITVLATVSNAGGPYTANVSTGGEAGHASLTSKADGRGVSPNGGELLCLALASCFTNDLYREAEDLGIPIRGTTVTVRATFGGRGEPARSAEFDVWVSGVADAEELETLVRTTDEVAEVQNTLRLGIPVQLSRVDVEPVSP